MRESERAGQRETEVHYKELAHVMMEAEKSCDCICKLEAQDSWWYSSSPSVKAREPGEPMIQVLGLEQKEPKIPAHSQGESELFLPQPFRSV